MSDRPFEDPDPSARQLGTYALEHKTQMWQPGSGPRDFANELAPALRERMWHGESKGLVLGTAPPI